MKTVLVVYYSWGGHTRRLGREIARALHADVEEIAEAAPRRGPFAWLRSGWEAMVGASVALKPLEHDPSRYRVVLVGSPVWMWGLSSPARSWCAAHGRQAKQVGFFCTMGGSGSERAFAAMQALCGRKPVATLAVDEKHLGVEGHREALQRFVTSVSRAAG